MSHDNDGAIRILRLLACRLEEYLEGDELALETLGEALEQEETTADDLNAAILGLRECRVLLLGGVHGRALDRPCARAVAHELHFVPRHAALEVEHARAVLAPLLERYGPRQVEQVGCVGAQMRFEDR